MAQTRGIHHFLTSAFSFNWSIILSSSGRSIPSSIKWSNVGNRFRTRKLICQNKIISIYSIDVYLHVTFFLSSEGYSIISRVSDCRWWAYDNLNYFQRYCPSRFFNLPFLRWWRTKEGCIGWNFFSLAGLCHPSLNFMVISNKTIELLSDKYSPQGNPKLCCYL